MVYSCIRSTKYILLWKVLDILGTTLEEARSDPIIFDTGSVDMKVTPSVDDKYVVTHYLLDPDAKEVKSKTGMKSCCYFKKHFATKTFHSMETGLEGGIECINVWRKSQSSNSGARCCKACFKTVGNLELIIKKYINDEGDSHAVIVEHNHLLSLLCKGFDSLHIISVVKTTVDGNEIYELFPQNPMKGYMELIFDDHNLCRVPMSKLSQDFVDQMKSTYSNVEILEVGESLDELYHYTPNPNDPVETENPEESEIPKESNPEESDPLVESIINPIIESPPFSYLKSPEPVESEVPQPEY